MTPDRLRELLAAVARGEITPEDAAARLADLPYADLGYAKLDLHRELRNGLPEAVYGEGKTETELIAIARRLVAAHGRVLITRLAPQPAAAVAAEIPGAVYHQRARVLTAGEPPAPPAGTAPIALVAAGTADLAVAEEAAVCAEHVGLPVERHADVGVAGLHRLLAVLPALRRARAVIVAAGMDGALPTALAGLIPAPVIAVPTSTGYGAAFGGIAPLLTMLNACAPGVAVVNIDNGYGAAVVAWRIAGSGRPVPAEPDRSA
jgi:NCAIR mutase (PurE)-related protein